jgi:hypothetical protein
VRRGRRRQESREEELLQADNDESVSFVSASNDRNPVNVTKRKNWTRSLSPRRSFNTFKINNNITSSDDASITSQLHESFSHNVVAPVMNSLKRLAGRSARSQSPRRRYDFEDSNNSSAAAAIFSRNDSHASDDKQKFLDATEPLQKRPARINSAPAGSSSPKEIALPGLVSSLQKPRRSRSSSSAGGIRKRRSKSPTYHMDQREEAVSRGGGKSPLKPPSGTNLMKQYHESYTLDEEVDKSTTRNNATSGRHSKDRSIEDRLPKYKPRPPMTSELPRSSKSLARPRSKRRIVNETDVPNPLSARSLDKPPPRKPSSDPGAAKAKGSASPKISPSKQKGPSTTQKKRPSAETNKPPSDNTLASSSSHHEKPSSDPGHYTTAGMAGVAVDRVPRPSPVISRPNLNKESLQHVADVKESIRRMRTQQYSQRHKVKFDGDGGSGVTKSKSAPPSMTASAAAIATSLHDSQGSMTEDSQNPSSATRLQGITMEDLEVGHLKTPIVAKRTFMAHSPIPENPPSTPGQLTEHEERVEALQKSIRKSKKLVKRCCREVWTERDEITHLQRTNWSIRKALLQTDAPKETITTLNLKLEKTLRQEREIAAELDEYQEEKQQLELECSQMTKTIEEFKNLLDALNTQVVPLFPPNDNGVDDDENFYATEGTKAATAVMNLLDDDDFSDSMHSMDG